MGYAVYPFYGCQINRSSPENFILEWTQAIFGAFQSGSGSVSGSKSLSGSLFDTDSDTDTDPEKALLLIRCTQISDFDESLRPDDRPIDNTILNMIVLTK